MYNANTSCDERMCLIDDGNNLFLRFWLHIIINIYWKAVCDFIVYKSYKIVNYIQHTSINGYVF
jgi:hypothetical protein